MAQIYRNFKESWKSINTPLLKDTLNHVDKVIEKTGDKNISMVRFSNNLKKLIKEREEI